jgi:hypothetical protein
VRERSHAATIHLQAKARQCFLSVLTTAPLVDRSRMHARTHTHAVGFHNPDQVSPHMDALVKEGVQLEGHYTFQFCSPTRSAFLSGR